MMLNKRDKKRADGKDAFLNELKKGLKQGEALKNINLTKVTIGRWRKEDKEFDEKVKAVLNGGKLPAVSGRKLEVIISLVKNHGIVSETARQCNIDRNSINRWRRDDEDFKKAFEFAREEASEDLRDLVRFELVKKLKGGNVGVIKFMAEHLLGMNGKEDLDKGKDGVNIRIFKK